MDRNVPQKQERGALLTPALLPALGGGGGGTGRQRAARSGSDTFLPPTPSPQTGVWTDSHPDSAVHGTFRTKDTL